MCIEFHNRLRVAAVTLPVILLACSAAVASAQVKVLDLVGRSVDPLAGARSQPTVFIFTRTDCPISNRYAPEIQRLKEEFAAHHVTFWLVFVDPHESSEAIRKHVNEYGYRLGVLRDPSHALVKLTGVRVTPEVAVFVPDGSEPRMVYRGRIDDKYVDFGKERPQPTTHDLERVLKTIAEGKPVKTETTRAVGCFISDLETR
jgi:hypothetical protein